MFYKIFLLSLFLYIGTSYAQVPTVINTTSIKFADGSDPCAHLYSYPPDTAKDNTWFIKSFQYDIGGRMAVFGVDITQLWDTLTVQLVLEGSVDKTNWKGIDSVSVTTGTPGHYEKNSTILANFRYGYNRLRLGTGVVNFKGNILNPGALTFFIQTNFKERF